MNTAVTITAIIAGLLLALAIVNAIRDTAKAKHLARHDASAKAQAVASRVRAVLDERRREVADRETDGMLPFGTPGASWCDAVAVTCARVEEALREPVEPHYVRDAEQP